VSEPTPSAGEGSPAAPTDATDFIRARVAADLEAGRHTGVVTRFPPEPNGYLHMGHAKSICLNFGLAGQFEGRCHLRFDDTNPETEDVDYVESIQRDVKWLGFDWGEHLYHASDYFERLYQLAEELIKAGKAYVDGSSEDQIRALRGTVTEPGKASPDRDRPPEESLDLFRRMRAGEFEEGAYVLRAKIDMAAKNMKMRDPLLYRIRKHPHYRTGDAWCIYPFYDYTHCLSDAFEEITHSICTLEFENNRELYDWVVDELQDHLPARPRQIEFARLDLTYTVMSKRKLLQLVNEGRVSGWDDPRMPTISGMRRRGVTPEAIRAFCERIGVAKANSTVDVKLFEHHLRDDLNHRSPRVMAVLRPLKVVITNYPEGQTEELDASYWPHDVPKEGSRKVAFGRELYIEQDDFQEDPPKKFFRLAPGREVRLRYAYFVTCQEVVKNDAGEVVELRCTYDPETRGGAAPDGRSPKGTLHWVSASEGLTTEVRLYDRLFKAERPGADGDFLADLNPDSLQVVQAVVEPSLKELGAGEHVQLERQGYAFSDRVDSKPGRPVFNLTVPLRDSWGKKKAAPAKGDQAQKRQRKEKKGGGKKKRKTRDEVLAELSGDAATRFTRFADELALPVDDARVLASDEILSALLDEASQSADAVTKPVANLLVNELPRALEASGRSVEELPFGGATLAKLAGLVQAGEVSTKGAKEVFATLVAEGGDPEAIVEAKGLRQLSDPAQLRAKVDEVLAAHPERVAQYRDGKTNLRGFFVGQAMKATGGRANPKVLGEQLDAALAD
jgi:glutaminyl-tRNA synthetase